MGFAPNVRPEVTLSSFQAVTLTRPVDHTTGIQMGVLPDLPAY